MKAAMIHVVTLAIFLGFFAFLISQPPHAQRCMPLFPATYCPAP